MRAKISLRNVCVNGIDTHARSSTIRQMLFTKNSILSTKIPILKNINFDAKDGDRIGILGSNGSGKSSLLKVISGNYPIHSGTCIVEGRIAPLVEMGAGFDDELSGRQNIKLSYAYRGKLAEYSKDVEEKIIDFAELDEKIDLPLKTYSSGMRIRLAFASVIFQQPDILLLDEVFATGDAGFIEKSRMMMKKKWDEVPIAIFVSHSAKEISDLCNKCFIMDKGELIDAGSTDKMIDKYQKEILHLKESSS
ncbi:ATP-binding cassette domain-containing protein [Rickettsiaceae bacterium]|nr:ATP-binding cassette domain-containing protein [Rickettsiaceae bacterium]